MGELIELFPSGQPPEEQPGRDHLSLDLDAIREPFPHTCAGVLHVFDAVPGRCQCGEELWTPEGLLDSQHIGLHQVG